MAYAKLDGRNSELFCQETTSSIGYTHGTNTAIHHSQLFTPAAAGTTGTASYAQWYMAGMIGYTGNQGLTTTQAIQNLQRTIAGDGCKPAGTMYFEQNDDIRTTCRLPFWGAVQRYMSANNILWIQETNSWPGTPGNRRDVMGAEIGAAMYLAPNGSVYLPGSWADSLTSYGGLYACDTLQTQANTILLSGGGGSSGTIAEPMATASRFPTAALTAFSNDGSTLGESFYRTVSIPDMNMFQGDLLSQAYADIPSVTFTSAPVNGATVSGSVSISGSAMLPNLTSQSTATGIASLSLFVDGRNTGASITGASGAFILDTTQLTDGIHEVRLVAYNNSAAASEGCAMINLQVNNLGQSVSVTGSSNDNVAASQAFSIPVSATQGSGPSITGIQLQSLGRVVGSMSGLSGNVSLSGTSLAYGSNTIIPVAILADGRQVQGQPVTIIRRFQPLAGTPSTLLANRSPGFDFYYYPGVAQKTIAATNFSGTPAYVQHGSTLQIVPESTSPYLVNMPAAYRTSAGGSNVGLGVMVKSSFTVTTPGEYSFSFDANSSDCWTSYSLSIDGVTIASYDCWNGSTLTLFSYYTNTLQSAYLLPGEHSLTVKLANYPSGSASTADANMHFLLRFRGPDANVRGSNGMVSNEFITSGFAAGPYFYTVKKNVGH
jgi:hypothetical protein